MKEIQLPPRAAALSESMRDIGYSLEAAIADIVDNSISAMSSKVGIFFNAQGAATCIAIVDDGCGMGQDELIEAMRHGSRSPRDVRPQEDLGRFGLGLKTASSSQCKRLTVASTKEGSTSCVRWDLGLVSDRDDWIACLLDDAEIGELPYIETLDGNGTIVIWENVDRLQQSGTESINERLINERMREVEKHLSLVFHRFLSGEVKGRKRLHISINYHEIEPFDPFCLANRATQILNREIIRVDGSEVTIQPYILPHHSRLTARERDFYDSRSDFLNNQGAYVYRNERLMAWGNWFRLVPKGEATKLARIRIDFSSSLDEYWTIDIKKSKAYPPHCVREQLRKIIGRISERATDVHRGKGKRLYASNPSPIWLRTMRDGVVEYSLDRQHPIIRGVVEGLDEQASRNMTEVLSLVESSVPVAAIYSDYSTKPQDFERESNMDKDDVLDGLEAVYHILAVGQEVTEESFREVVCHLKPYCDFEDLTEAFIRSKFNVCE